MQLIELVIKIQSKTCPSSLATSQLFEIFKIIRGAMMEEYLQASQIIDWQDPLITDLAQTILSPFGTVETSFKLTDLESWLSR